MDDHPGVYLLTSCEEIAPSFRLSPLCPLLVMVRPLLHVTGLWAVPFRAIAAIPNVVAQEGLDRLKREGRNDLAIILNYTLPCSSGRERTAPSVVGGSELQLRVLEITPRQRPKRIVSALTDGLLVTRGFADPFAAP